MKLQSELAKSIESAGPLGLFCSVTLSNTGEICARYGLDAMARAMDEFNFRLSSVLRPKDTKFTLTPDQFCLVLRDFRAKNQAVLFGVRVEMLFSEPMMFDENAVSLEVRAGLVHLDGLHDAQVVYALAEQQRQSAALDEVIYHIASPKTQTADALGLERQVLAGMENHEMYLRYQPKVCLATGEIDSYEGLVRWNRNGEELLPGQFLPKLRAKALGHLNCFVVRQAIRDLIEMPWCKQLSINVDPVVNLDADFVDFVRGELSIWDVEPSKLCIEITESSVVSDYVQTNETVKDLNDLGVDIAIDDFGTGYSSLRHFRDLAVQEIKIDRCFIKDMSVNESSVDIIKVVLDLAHRLDRRVVAEGIEDRRTLDALLELGCDLGQGFYLSKPMLKKDLVGRRSKASERITRHRRDRFSKAHQTCLGTP